MPYLDVILHAFTPERLMFGSDWPLPCSRAATKTRINWSLITSVRWALRSNAKIFGDNACRFYGI